MNIDEIINKIAELDNKLLIPKEGNLEKANLKETFKTMTNDDFETFYEVLKERDEYEKEIERLNNIIDELEKAILNTYPCMNMYEQDFKSELLNILKDLKGEN